MKKQYLLIAIGMIIMITNASACADEAHDSELSSEGQQEVLSCNDTDESYKSYSGESCECSLCNGEALAYVKGTAVGVGSTIKSACVGSLNVLAWGAQKTGSFLDASLEVLGTEDDTTVCDRKTRINAIKTVISRSLDAGLLLGTIYGAGQCGHSVMYPAEPRIWGISQAGNTVGQQRFVYGGISALSACLLLLKQ